MRYREDVEFLLTPAGQALLEAAQATYDGCNALSVAETLGRSNTSSHVAAALSLVDLRRKAVPKFGSDADRMYFTRDGLEQATHRLVADQRAARIRGSGVTSVLDLGCGIGSDLLSAARQGLCADGVDRDPVAAMAAAANLQALALPGTVVEADAMTVDRTRHGVVFADPARRDATGRVFDPGAFSPPWSFVAGLLAGTAVVKAGPALRHDLVPPQVEAEWVSVDGALKETALWSGQLATARRRATLLRGAAGVGPGTLLSGAASSMTLTEADLGGVPDVRGVGRYVYEPDVAVIRAHLVAAVVEEVGGWLLDPHLAYVSSDVATATRFASCFEVLEVLPFQEKVLRAALRARNVGRVTIKKRGVNVTPEQLRSRLALSGQSAATVILSRTPSAAVALLVEPRPSVSDAG